MNSSIERIEYIDALRGFAIFGSLVQHIGIWLIEPGYCCNYMEHPIFWGISGVTGLAGPLFVALAGLSAILMVQRHPDKDAIFVKRGLLIIFYGYLLNFLTPNWFSGGSWFVLHMIGFGILTTPLVRRASTAVLIVASIFFLLVAAAAHYYLNTPLFIDWDLMNDHSRAGGVLRLVLFEGQFPIFPWISFYIAGFVTYRLIEAQKIPQLLALGFCSLCVAGTLFAFNFAEVGFAVSGPTATIFRGYLGFYPVTPMFFFGIYPLFIFIVLVFRYIGSRVDFGPGNPMISLGRSSLTIYFVHIVVGQGLRGAGLLPHYDSVTVTVPILGSVAFFTIMSVIWAKYNYKYGPEWLLRRIPI